MMLGKRQRPVFKRTTSMTEITLDLNDIPPPPADGVITNMQPPEVFENNPFHGLDHRFASAATVSPRPKSSNRHRNQSVDDVVETAQFLKTCFYCKRRLNSGRDIYIYRGENAFCSPECRQQQINKDERKEKCSLATKKEASTILTASSEVSTNPETLAAI